MPIGSCSRDPIGYEDGLSLYFSGMQLSSFDPSGTSITKKEKDDLKGCGCQAYQVSQLPSNAGGWVECKNGDFVPKLSDPKKHPQEDCQSKCGATDCEKDHENHHIDQFKEFCPDACKPDPCSGVSKDGWVMGFTGGQDCVSKSECYAYKIQLDCLKSKHEDEKKKKPADRTYCDFKTPTGSVKRSCLIYLKDEHQNVRQRILKPFDPKNPYAGQYGCIRDYKIPIDPIK